MAILGKKVALYASLRQKDARIRELEERLGAREGVGDKDREMNMDMDRDHANA